MMEALGQLAKDGSLLAPTHKHIGISQFTPIFCSFTIFNFHISTKCSFSLQSSCRRFLRLQRGFGEKSSGIPAGKVHLQGWTNLESSESESNSPGGTVIEWVKVFARVKGKELLLNLFFSYKSINCHSEASSSFFQESYTQCIF